MYGALCLWTVGDKLKVDLSAYRCMVKSNGMFYHFQHSLSIAGAGMHFSDLQLFLINPGTRAAPDAAMSRGSSREFQDRKSETFPPQWTWWIVGTCCINIYMHDIWSHDISKSYINIIHIVLYMLHKYMHVYTYLLHRICPMIFMIFAQDMLICKAVFIMTCASVFFDTIYKKICIFRYIGAAPYRLS